MEKTRIRNASKAHVVQKVSEITGVTCRQVYRVINGESDNEAVMTAYMEIIEGEQSLLAKVKALIKF